MTDEHPDPDLDAELRRLFADERLTLPVAVDAEQVVVTGARRRQRRRLAVAAAGGVLAVAAIVFLASALPGIGRAPGPPVAAASRLLSPTLTTTDPGPTQVSDPNQLGPDGLGGLWLGMSLPQALPLVQRMPSASAKGQIGSCFSYVLTNPVVSTPESNTVRSSGLKYPSGLVTVEISPQRGIVQLGGGGEPGLHTPEGIGIGTPSKTLYSLYPNVVPTAVDRSPGSAIVPVPGRQDTYYVFDIGPTGTVVAIWLRSGVVTGCTP